MSVQLATRFNNCSQENLTPSGLRTVSATRIPTKNGIPGPQNVHHCPNAMGTLSMAPMAPAVSQTC